MNTTEEWTETMDLLVSNARLLLALEPKLKEALDSVIHWQTVGPILDPTAYIRGGRENLHDQEVLLRAALTFCAKARTLDRGAQ